MNYLTVKSSLEYDIIPWKKLMKLTLDVPEAEENTYLAHLSH